MVSPLDYSRQKQKTINWCTIRNIVFFIPHIRIPSQNQRPTLHTIQSYMFRAWSTKQVKLKMCTPYRKPFIYLQHLISSFCPVSSWLLIINILPLILPQTKLVLGKLASQLCSVNSHSEPVKTLYSCAVFNRKVWNQFAFVNTNLFKLASVAFLWIVCPLLELFKCEGLWLQCQ